MENEWGGGGRGRKQLTPLRSSSVVEYPELGRDPWREEEEEGAEKSPSQSSRVTHFLLFVCEHVRLL